MNEESFAELMRSLDPGMAVVTAADGDERAGCLVGFHGQTSIDPPRYGVWLSKANHTYRVALQATHLAVHLLADDTGGADRGGHDGQGAHDRKLAEWFGSQSGDDVDKFADLAWAPGPGGVPLLEDCPRRLVLRRAVMVDDGGDHVCLTGDPVEATAPFPFHPLRLGRVADLTPGHTAEERPSPPTERASGD